MQSHKGPQLRGRSRSQRASLGGERDRNVGGEATKQASLARSEQRKLRGGSGCSRAVRAAVTVGSRFSQVWKHK